MSCFSRVANSQLLYQFKWLFIITARIQLETRNSPSSPFSGNKVLQAALHEEQQALQLLTPKVKMMTKSEHELGYCVAPPCCVASEEYKSDKAGAERGKHGRKAHLWWFCHFLLGSDIFLALSAFCHLPEVSMHTGVAWINSFGAGHTLDQEWGSSFLLNRSF